jgi:hypothetical protein
VVTGNESMEDRGPGTIPDAKTLEVRIPAEGSIAVPPPLEDAQKGRDGESAISVIQDPIDRQPGPSTSG